MSDSTGKKDTNPKDSIGGNKLPLNLWPASATSYGCLGMLDGALKYGRDNFRAAGIRYSIYSNALRRHLDALDEGEWIDRIEDGGSGLPHLAHILATAAILAEGFTKGNITDDRKYPTNYRTLVDNLTPEVKRLKEKHAAMDPHHYTIHDEAELPSADPVDEAIAELQVLANSDCIHCKCWETKHEFLAPFHCRQCGQCPGYAPAVPAAGRVPMKEWKARK